MTHQRIKVLQMEHNVKVIQDGINNASIWKYEGSISNLAKKYLEIGACMYPDRTTRNKNGDVLPSRDDVKRIDDVKRNGGGVGSLKNCQNFWYKLLRGEVSL